MNAFRRIAGESEDHDIFRFREILAEQARKQYQWDHGRHNILLTLVREMDEEHKTMAGRGGQIDARRAEKFHQIAQELVAGGVPLEGVLDDKTISENAKRLVRNEPTVRRALLSEGLAETAKSGLVKRKI